MASIKKALSTPDAIAAVTGPIGGGKTTVVGRALEGVAAKLTTVSVGRIRLGHDEVLELLLGELGAEEMPAGTVQRFALFRRMLRQFSDEGARVVIVVEDAGRMGEDSLAELEALTGADGGVSDGANVVLMGDDGLNKLLDKPQLARVKQRLRLRQSLPPLTEKELLAYFKHCFRLVGGEFDSLFADGASAVLHELSGGIPRMANNIVESAMLAAAEAGDKRVSIDQIRNVAAGEYGLESGSATESEPKTPTAPPIAAPKPAPVGESAPGKTDAGETETVESSAPEKDDIPELIQDTLPDLEVLAPQLADHKSAKAARHRAETDEDEPTPSVEDIPTLRKPSPDNEGDEIPDWERDPTLAELRPDLDALEHAMAVAQGAEKEPANETPIEPPVAAPEKEPEEVPAITLDREIQAKIEEAAEAIKRTEEAAAAKAAAAAEAEKTIDIADTGEVQIELPPLKTGESGTEASAEPAAKDPASPAAPEPPKATETLDSEKPSTEKRGEDVQELERIATDLSRARTIDDVDDKMAETLFGEEFSEIAAQIAATPSPSPANDELELALDEEPVAKPAPIGNIDGSAAVNVSSGAGANGATAHLDEAASKRLATVRALNGSKNVPPPMPSHAESIVMAHEPQATALQPGSDQPQPIEEQINTSMTATLEALKMRPPEDDDDEEQKGFFSRFRKS